MGKPLLLIVNRIDLVTTDQLEGYLENLEKTWGVPPIPVSAYKGLNIETLRQSLVELLDLVVDTPPLT